MERQYYYVDFINGKYRIVKQFIHNIQTDSIYDYYWIEFINGARRYNSEVFEQRRKARQLRDKLNKNKKVRR